MGPREKADTSDGFQPTIPSTLDCTSPALDALRMDGALDRGTLSPALHRLLLNMARVKNAVSSLRLEGIEVDLERARRAVERRESLDPSDREVLAFAERYAWVHETPRNQLPDLDVDFVTSLHGELLRFDDEIPSEAVGRLKTKQNVIRDGATGQATFVTTPPDRTEAELRSLLRWLEAVEGTVPPAVVAAIFFAEFQGIHPFRDGNGRVGRLLNAVLLKRLKHQNVALVPLDGRFYATSSRYYEAIASTNDGTTWHVWCRYFSKQLRRAYEVAMKRSDLQPLLDSQSGQVTRSVLEWVLQGHGQRFKRGDFPNPQGFSRSAVTKALADLVEQGVLTPEGEKRGRTYRLATEFLQSIYGGSADDLQPDTT